MFYERLDLLCAERGLTISGLLKELGISPSSASRWKALGYAPSRDTAKKIADYFGITVRQLMSGEIEKIPAAQLRVAGIIMSMYSFSHSACRNKTLLPL